MSNEPKLCWGGCGRPLIFIRTKNKGRRRVLALDAVTNEYHRCPRALAPPIFIEAMMDFGPVECVGCGKMISDAPTCYGIMQFEADNWTWHNCQSLAVLKDIWYLPVFDLDELCRRYVLPEPRRRVITVCVKRMAGDEPKYIVALKSVLGRKCCIIFVGHGKFRLGELSVLCGDGLQQKLLTDSNQIFDSHGQGQPASLGLSHRWLEDAG